MITRQLNINNPSMRPGDSKFWKGDNLCELSPEDGAPNLTQIQAFLFPE